MDDEIRSTFELDIMKLGVDICSICKHEDKENIETCGSKGCEEFQSFHYRDM